ncbi:MAG: FeoA domain-containing protein [Microcoleaceae cyanobacterium]
MQNQFYCPVCFAEVVEQVKNCPICHTNFEQWKQKYTDLEQIIHSLKHPNSQVRQNSIKKLANQQNPKVAIALAECALAYPDDIWQNCEIIKALRKILPSTEKETAFKMLLTHPVKIIREAAEKSEKVDNKNLIKTIKLSDLNPQNPAIIKHIEVGTYGKGLVKRLTAMGVVVEKPIIVLRKSWFSGPIHLRVGANTELAIRREEAKTVMVKPLI